MALITCTYSDHRSLNAGLGFVEIDVQAVLCCYDGMAVNARTVKGWGIRAVVLGVWSISARWSSAHRIPDFDMAVTLVCTIHSIHEQYKTRIPVHTYIAYQHPFSRECRKA